MADKRTPAQLALELYSRGYTNTRHEADTLVAENPDGARFLLSLPRLTAETQHTGDTASIDEWGHAG